MLLCFLGQGYVWMNGQAGLVNKVPRKLAVPWVAVGDRLGLVPVLTYASSVLYNFQLLSDSIQAMEKEVNRMYDGCDPVVFFATIRHFFAGYKGLDAFPEGIMYEGVDPKPRKYHGASAGQSSSVYAFDMFLGTKHSEEEQQEFVMAMRDYMPRKHSAFLAELGKMPSVRDYCANSGNPELVACYNQAVEALVSFRKNHIVLVTRYILNQVKHSVNPALDKKGTGGTEFSFLKKVRDDTEALKILVVPQD